MQPILPEKQADQGELFRSRLDQILNHAHPLYELAQAIGWEVFVAEFGERYAEKGRPGVAIRLMVGLHYLKQLYNESDESVVLKFIENPYWQYFCGLTHFTHRCPIDPSSMTRFRNRIGPGGAQRLLRETLDVAQRQGALKPQDVKRVNVDTTVQEKAVAFPTDARLYHKARRRLVREAKRCGIELRQSYARLGQRALIKQGRYAHAQQMRRARRETKKLRTYLGRVMRDIERQCTSPDVLMSALLERSNRIYVQQREDKNKLYSLHAPEVECIAKGKAHRRYEFGCKVSLVSTSQGNWVLAADALHGNPYDGHTLKQALAQAQENSALTIKQAFCDKGYRGVQALVPDVEVLLSGKKTASRALRAWLKRRQAIEPIISHLKFDHGMARNHLLGKDGDKFNATLAACGFNLRKLLGALLRFIFCLWSGSPMPTLDRPVQPLLSPL